jgi:hypothetical protein
MKQKEWTRMKIAHVRSLQAQGWRRDAAERDFERKYGPEPKR